MAASSTPPSHPDDSIIDAFVQRAREDRKQIKPEVVYPTLDATAAFRRTTITAGALGILTSLTFSVMAIGWNALLLAGLPVQQSFLSPWTTTAAVLLFVPVFSLVSASSMKIQNRVVITVLVLIVLAVFYNLYREYGNLIAGIMELIAFLYLFSLPILIGLLCFVPFGLFIRWAVSAQVKYFYQPFHYWKRAVPLLVHLAVTVFAGTLFIHSTVEQNAIRDMDRMIRQASRAQAEEGLPERLQNISGTPFFPFARGSYHLVAAHNPIPRRVTYGGEAFLMDIEVTARFQSGYWFTCQYTRTGALRGCRSDFLPPLPTVNG